MVIILVLLAFSCFSTWSWVQTKAAKDRLTSQVNSLNSQLDVIRGELSTTQSQLSEVETDLQKTEKELTDVKDESSGLAVELQLKKDQLSQAEEQVVLYQEQADDLARELKDSEATLEACFSDVYYSMNYSYVRSSPLGFKLLCAEDDCDLPYPKLEEIFYDMQHATLSFEEALAVDIKDYYRSIEVHATTDNLCKSMGVCAYAAYVGYSSGLPRGLICFDAPGCESKPDVFIHELGHQLWHGQGIPNSVNEGFSKMLQGILGHKNDDVIQLFAPESFCHSSFSRTVDQAKNSRYNKGILFWHELCKRHGFDIGDLPAFFDLAEQQPEYHTDGLQFDTFIDFINQITGENVRPTVDEIVSIPTEGAVCGDSKCERDEWYYCRGDC